MKYILILLITILALACENDLHKVQHLGSKGIGIEEGKDIVSYMSQAGKVRAKLTAPLMLRHQLQVAKVEFPKSLHVLFYDSLLHVESELFAKYGSYLENENKVFLKDSVIVFNIKHDTLWCKELTWDQNKSTFYTDKPIKISQQNPGQTIYGMGLTADQNFKWFSIQKVGRVFTGHDNFISVPDSTF